MSPHARDKRARAQAEPVIDAALAAVTSGELDLAALKHEAECFRRMVARWVRLKIPFREWEELMRLAYVLEALRLHGGNQVQAAEHIQLHRNVLRYVQESAVQAAYSGRRPKVKDAATSYRSADR